MKRIHITVINDLTYDQRMHRICNTLVNHGYNVKLIGRRLRSSVGIQSEEFCQKRIKCFFNRGKLFYIEYNFRLFFYLLFQRFDIICACDLDTILPALVVSKFRKKKRIYDAHEYFTEVPELINRPRVKKFWEWVAKYSIQKMHRCYTVNDSLAQIFKKKYRQNFETIMNLPLLNEKLNLNPKLTEDKFILYQGAINKGRGLELLVKATKHVDIKVKIAGDGDITEKIRQLITKLGINDKVELLGRFSPTKLKELTPKAYIGYNLLDDKSLNYYYSLDNKFFSYIHAGVPSISSNFPEYKRINDIIEVSLLSDLSLENLINSINLLLENHDYYQNLRDNCIKARKLYKWQNEENKLLDIYNEL